MAFIAPKFCIKTYWFKWNLLLNRSLIVWVWYLSLAYKLQVVIRLTDARDFLITFCKIFKNLNVLEIFRVLSEKSLTWICIIYSSLSLNMYNLNKMSVKLTNFHFKSSEKVSTKWIESTRWKGCGGMGKGVYEFRCR